MNSVFDRVKEKVEEIKEKSQALEKELNEMKEKFNEIDEKSTHCTSFRNPEIEKLTEKNDELADQILDLKCRSMKYNLIFNGIHEEFRENTENVLRDFLAEHLEIDYRIEFTNIHRFGKRNKKRARPIVAKFIYQDDLDHVLLCAKKLKGKSYRINRQFPEETEQARKSLYPIMKDLKRKGERVKLVRDILYVNGEPYYPETEVEHREPP